MIFIPCKDGISHNGPGRQPGVTSRPAATCCYAMLERAGVPVEPPFEFPSRPSTSTAPMTLFHRRQLERVMREYATAGSMRDLGRTFGVETAARKGGQD